MLTARQIDLIQESFAQVLPVTPAAAHFFYDRLFTLAPDTRKLFTGNMDEQGRKLFQTLAIVVDALHDISGVLPVCGALAVRHVQYGVQEKHYDIVGIALIDTLEHGLGDGFDEEVRVAWRQAYNLLSSHMIHAARASLAA